MFMNSEEFGFDFGTDSLNELHALNLTPTVTDPEPMLILIEVRTL